ncbi:hypothetical protein DPX16_16698 [Anabarilius grahami]|uniref:Uncharacterized protein n=1 Tax=Anabarilius grahami TaxID=495550 RepID=A0A3N0YSA5_ANAGA|nr:hypothetical protein DPX16_16698 [Anabarilius grahami]
MKIPPKLPLLLISKDYVLEEDVCLYLLSSLPISQPCLHWFPQLLGSSSDTSLLCGFASGLQYPAPPSQEDPPPLPPGAVPITPPRPVNLMAPPWLLFPSDPPGTIALTGPLGSLCHRLYRPSAPSGSALVLSPTGSTSVFWYPGSNSDAHHCSYISVFRTICVWSPGPICSLSSPLAPLPSALSSSVVLVESTAKSPPWLFPPSTLLWVIVLAVLWVPAWLLCSWLFPGSSHRHLRLSSTLRQPLVHLQSPHPPSSVGLSLMQ